MNAQAAAPRATAAGAPRTVPGFARRFGAVLALALVGLAGLPWMLARQLAATPLPEPLAHWPLPAAVALSLLNPLVLLVAACLTGAACAHRVGLGSAVAGTHPMPRRSAWLVATGTGLALAALLALLDAWAASRSSTSWPTAAGPAAATAPQLALGLLYGGIAEEVLLRWGAMSAIAWLLHRLAARSQAQAPAWTVATAAFASAALFAAAHLPALAAAMPLTPELVVRTLALNLLAGLAYAWLFWRSGLEAAMAAHASTHAGFALLAILTT